MEWYAQVYEKLLAVPVVKGIKSEEEKFAGALYTTTVEAFIPEAGRGVQGATSHCLGQNFAKMFNIQFEDKQGSKSFVWQNSWGITTRTIGVALMVHGDDNGCNWAPYVAPTQLVIMPCGLTKKIEDSTRLSIETACKDLLKLLKKTKFEPGMFKDQNPGLIAVKCRKLRVVLDDRENVTAGYKFNHWELLGTPIRIEIGPRDIENNSCTAVIRCNRSKHVLKLPSHNPNFMQELADLMETTHELLYTSALEKRNKQCQQVVEWKLVLKALDNNCTVLIPWCKTTECENDMKKRTAEHGELELEKFKAKMAKRAAKKSKKNADKQVEEQETVEDEEEQVAMPVSMGMKSLCMPLEQPKEELKNCVGCDKPALIWGLFGRSY